jgi:catechol 2,3-dioxygenase-like lactoylglutathione lyase family enzyme
VPTPPRSRILETSLYVADLAVSRRFYETLFGFDVLLLDERMCAMAIPGRQVLLLFRIGASVAPSETPFGVIPPHDGRGTQHLCFSIARSDLAPWEAHLHKSAITLDSRVKWPAGGSSLYFRDPDGHSLEVATSGLWKNDPLELA